MRVDRDTMDADARFVAAALEAAGRPVGESRAFAAWEASSRAIGAEWRRTDNMSAATAAELAAPYLAPA